MVLCPKIAEFDGSIVRRLPTSTRGHGGGDANVATSIAVSDAHQFS